MLSKAYTIFDKIIKVILIVLLTGMVIIGFMQVFFRYVLNNSLTWSEELIRYMFVWATFLGMPVGVGMKTHVSFDLIFKKIPAKIKPYYSLFLYILMGIAFAMLICYGFPYAMGNIKQFTPALRVPYTYVILAVPVGGCVGMVYLAHCIRELFAKEDEKQ